MVINKDKQDLRVLCGRCKENYNSAGYATEFSSCNVYKQPCDICNRYGYEYIIKKGGIYFDSG